MSRLGVLEGENQCMFKTARWDRGGGQLQNARPPSYLAFGWPQIGQIRGTAKRLGETLEKTISYCYLMRGGGKINILFKYQ